MPETKTIPLSGIAVAIHRLRALRPDKVDALAQSMTDQGLLQPIVVRRHKGGGYLLVAGLHRLKAAKKLKWKKITCTVFDDMEADEAELVEIDENLVRADLSPAERALQIGRRQELYEKKHGKAKARGGHASQAAQGHKANAKLAVAFTKDATKKTRQSERTVQRDATRAKKVAVLPDIAGTPLDKGAEIDALAKLPVEKQRSLAEAAKRGEQVSAISALSACDPEAAKASDGNRNEADRAPTLDPRAWSMATQQEREAFVKEVGLRDIENVINAIDPIIALTRGYTLTQAWDAATPPERLAFARQYHDVIKTLGWQQKWR